MVEVTDIMILPRGIYLTGQRSLGANDY